MIPSSLHIDWDPWGPTWFVVLAFAAVAGFLWWLYRVDARRLTPARRRLLLAWRVITVCTVLLALMRPSYKLVTSEERPPVTAVVLDESLSMGLPEASDNPFIVNYLGERDRAKKSRYAAAKNAAAAVVPDLAKTHRVKLFVASDQLRPVADFPKGEKISPADVARALEQVPAPTGNYSSLGESVDDTMKSLSSARLSAVFLLTDGRLTSGKRLADAGAEAAARKVPIYTVGFGTAEPLPDLKLVDLVAPPEANVNDVMTVQVSVINDLRPNLAVNLKLFQENVPEPVATQKLILPLGEKKASISTVPNLEGEIKYRLEVPTFPEELDTENNAVSFRVNVAKRQLRVLLIAGAPTMEFHHLVPALVRDKVVKVNCWLTSADVNAPQQGNDTPIDDLPQTPAQWNRYDVVVLFDADPNRLSDEQVNGLEQLVREQGGGLIFVAGRVHGLAALLRVRGAKMEAMLPVEINKNQYSEYETLYTTPFRCVRTRAGETHPIALFAPTKERNDEVWRSFGELDFYWSYPVTGVKRMAVPLLVRRSEGTAAGGGGGRDCVMAMMKYGKGSTAYLGLNTMWKWRYPMESYDYDQFWTQTVRYLAEYRMLGAQRQVMISTDKKIYAPGEKVQVQLSVLDPALANQLRTEQVFATITDAHKGEYRVMLQSAGRDLSARRGTFPAARIGEHLVRVSHVLAEDMAARKALFDESTHFDVRLQSLEFRDTTADLAGLAALAEQTGAKSLDHTTMGEGLRKLPPLVDASPQQVPHESFADLWDQWYVLTVLIALAAVELWFRRNWGLL